MAARPGFDPTSAPPGQRSSRPARSAPSRPLPRRRPSRPGGRPRHGSQARCRWPMTRSGSLRTPMPRRLAAYE